MTIFAGESRRTDDSCGEGSCETGKWSASCHFPQFFTKVAKLFNNGHFSEKRN